MKRCARKVEHFAKPLCPVNFQRTPFGELIWFTRDVTLSTVLKAYGLLSIAKDSAISIAQSIDGAQLSKHLSHVMGGFKINDIRALCPFTKKPFLADPDDCHAQSRNNVFPCKTQCMVTIKL